MSDLTTVQEAMRPRWLRDLPKHWSVAALKTKAEIRNGATPSSAEPAFWEGDIPWATPIDLGNAGVREIETTGRFITRDGYESCGTTLVPAGSVIVSTRAPIGSLAIARVPMCFNQGCRGVIPSEETEARFLYYALNAFTDVLRVLGEGTTFKELSSSSLADLKLPWPTTTEQHAIASYLDAETKRIDELIAEKGSLLGMLDEFRSAAIFELLEGAESHDVERRDPGIGWLREVPSNWVVCGLGKRYEVQLGKMLDAKQITGDHLRPYLRNQDVQWRHINVENLPLMDFDAADQQRFSLQKGDVLVCEGGEVGRAAVWNSDFECFYQKAIHRLRPLTSEDEPEFVVLLLETAVKHGVFDTAEKSTIAHLPADQLRQHKFPFPPRSEQQRIVHQSRLVSDRVRDLHRHVTAEIEMLKELRAATITDAVLGRIDVRPT